jgi:hypothetical protein
MPTTVKVTKFSRAFDTSESDRTQTTFVIPDSRRLIWNPFREGPAAAEGAGRDGLGRDGASFETRPLGAPQDEVR